MSSYILTALCFISALLLAEASSQLCYGASTDLPSTTITATTLPPLLVRIEGGETLSVVPTDKAPRAMNPQEYLAFNDSFRLAPKMSFQIYSGEHIQFVAGGGFEGKLILAGFSIDRGWARMWCEAECRVETPLGAVTASASLTQDAQFWIYVEGGRADIYPLAGEIKVPPGAVVKRLTDASLKDKIKGGFPDLFKLADRAQDDWKAGKPEKSYAEMRKKGLRPVPSH